VFEVTVVPDSAPVPVTFNAVVIFAEDVPLAGSPVVLISA